MLTQVLFAVIKYGLPKSIFKISPPFCHSIYGIIRVFLYQHLLLFKISNILKRFVKNTGNNFDAFVIGKIQSILILKIFSKNPDWDAWIFLDVSGAASRTLCVGWTGPPMSASEYSGWNYDICAAVIENLGNSPTAPYTGEPEYTGYWQFVQQNVLQPLGMLASSPGGTRRDSFYHNESSISNEATYPATTYLEQTGVPVASSPFEQTILYTLADEIEPDDLWYYDLAVPLDVITPAYVTRPYGGGVSLRHEAVVPAGGWVSTAPDLARLPLALVAGSSPLSNPALAATVAPGENYSPACFLSYTPLCLLYTSPSPRD